MSARLEGKVALVTGAAQGIGRAIVEAFVAEGARVIATDLDRSEQEEFPSSPRIEWQTLDVTDRVAIRSAARSHPQVEVLVNCAGYVATGSILDAGYEDLERSWQINVGSIFAMTQMFLPGMVERRKGSIINIASVVSTVKAAPNRCVYATTKGAVIALTKSTALDVIRHGVRCNSISPGTVHTPSLDKRMAVQADPRAALSQFIARQPMGRLGMAEEIAATALLLASDEAQFMTGSNIVIDGGFSL